MAVLGAGPTRVCLELYPALLLAWTDQMAREARAFGEVADVRALGGQKQLPTQSDPWPQDRGEGIEVERGEATRSRVPPGRGGAGP